MAIKEGLIPTALGTAVTAAGATMVKKKMMTQLGAGILGFGLAHVVLGAIDLVEHRSRR